jgi:hypothetical protein
VDLSVRTEALCRLLSTERSGPNRLAAGLEHHGDADREPSTAWPKLIG